MKSSKLNYLVNEEHILLVKLSKNCVECVIKCVFCESQITCKFDQNGNIYNYTAHLRKHSQVFLPTQPSAQVSLTLPSVSTHTITENHNAKASEIQRANCSVLTEVESILR